jgi:hypothetical protein
MQSIPISSDISVNPGVLSAGGAAILLNGLCLTQNPLMPAATALPFTSAAAVAAFFGAASTEAAKAKIYFAGYDGSTAKPGMLYFAPYQTEAVAAFLRSGSLASLTLAELQAITPGTLTMTINGVTETSSSINFSSAGSFSAAAALIEAAFSGTVPTVSWNATLSAFVFDSPTTGSASTIGFPTTDAFATALNLTSATSALISQGDVADTPSSAMTKATAATQNFFSVWALFEPNLSNKGLFGVWFSEQNDAYLFLGYDTDAQAIVEGSTECFGVVGEEAGYSGMTLITGNAAYVAAQGGTLADVLQSHCAFYSGMIASVNFNQPNGRINFKFRAQAGLPIGVADQTSAQAALANNYNFYGLFANKTKTWTYFSNGNMLGPWLWANSFTYQAWLNASMQAALTTGAQAVNSFPYNAPGYELIRGILLDPITAGITFGAIRVGVTLSSAQQTEVNNASGNPAAASEVQTQGYYLQILDPGATVREAKGSPIINFWYADGEDVNQIQLGSTEIQ